MWCMKNLLGSSKMFLSEMYHKPYLKSLPASINRALHDFSFGLYRTEIHFVPGGQIFNLHELLQLTLPSTEPRCFHASEALAHDLQTHIRCLKHLHILYISSGEEHSNFQLISLKIYW